MCCFHMKKAPLREPGHLCWLTCALLPVDKLHRESHDPPGTGELMTEYKYSAASGSQALLSPPPWGCTGITPGQMPAAGTALQPGAGMDTDSFCFCSPD